MARIVEFIGGERFKDGHAYPTPPLAEPVKERVMIYPPTGEPMLDDQGNEIMEQIRGWEVGDTVLFDVGFAEKYGKGHTDEDANNFAEQHAGAWNSPYQHIYEPEQLPWQVREPSKNAGPDTAGQADEAAKVARQVAKDAKEQASNAESDTTGGE